MTNFDPNLTEEEPGAEEQPIEQQPAASQEQADIEAYMASLEEALADTQGCDYGGGCWVDLWGLKNGHPVKINMTSHARTPVGALKNLMIGMAFAEEKYKLHPYQPDSKPAPTQAVKPAAGAPAPAGQAARTPAPAGAAGAPPAPARTAAAPAAAGAPAGGSAVIVKVEVLPRADGKADVKFFAEGHQYPDVTLTQTPDRIATMFAAGTGAGWTPAHFQAAGQYPVSLRVTWVNSDKMNSKGNPYKNISKIENA